MVSPFADVEADVLPERTKRNSRMLWIGMSVAMLLLVAVGGIVFLNYLRDPFRILEPFPTGKYLDNYRSLAGLRFKAQLRVEADLGWKDGVGRLMLFSSTDEPRPFAVMIPASLGKEIHFTKGPTYKAELEVKEEGLIYANSCNKN